MYTKKNGRMTYKSNRRPNFKRNNNYASKGRNKGNVTQLYNKYLKLAKDTFSSGDRIQAEYYYQFTDHYYRLMLELGISLDEQDSSEDIKTASNDDNNSEDIKTASNDDNNIDANKNILEETNEKIEIENSKDEEVDQSIESVPFISDPIKKKRSRTSK